jgi:hypothetical protein
MKLVLHPKKCLIVLVEGVDELFKVWKPRPNYYIHRDTDHEPRKLDHSLIY